MVDNVAKKDWIRDNSKRLRHNTSIEENIFMYRQFFLKLEIKKNNNGSDLEWTLKSKATSFMSFRSLPLFNDIIQGW